MSCRTTLARSESGGGKAQESAEPRAALLDSISDADVRARVDEKLRELDAKNDAIHVRIVVFLRHVSHARPQASTRGICPSPPETAWITAVRGSRAP